MVNKLQEKNMKQPGKKAQKAINEMVAVLEANGYKFVKNDVGMVRGFLRLSIDPHKSDLQKAVRLREVLTNSGFPCSVDINKELGMGYRYVSLRFNGLKGVWWVEYLTIDELYGTVIFQF
jgi:hypothetical protein